ncbi:MAG: hypothetical protein QG564_1803 [Campylobacterota bacterium]|nr:hypothetical protein [Campylobacterota bacterium]
MSTREQIYSALLNLVSSVAEFNTKSRRLKLWTDVAPADMPAIFLLQQNEMAETVRGMDIKWTFRPELYIYVSVGNDQNANPYAILNPILDKVTDLFNSSKLIGGVQTLDGLVHSCKMVGGVETDGGVLGTVAVAIIPIEIITNI